MLRDWFVKGILAGFIAGVITKAYDLMAYYLHFSTLRWFDVAGTLIFGRKPLNLWEAVFATLSTWFFHALLGLMFVYLIQKTVLSRHNLFLKGWFYGVTWWFLIYVIIMLFKVPEISFVPLKTSLSNFISASIFGLLLAGTLQWLNHRSQQVN